ncbi:MAG TPA: DUF4097 family beta strand repeat-containing protein [Pyrinomonadaceae bacterium]|nr:DUF4097 family beta strand repeat-containing protein [Pyrinomonadaceae bacterium]
MSRKSLTVTLLLAAALWPAAGDASPAGTRADGAPAAEVAEINAAGTAAAAAGQSAQAQSAGELTEEFHQTYPLSPNGRVSLSNINGGVRVSSWDRNEVRVDAVKRAHKAERLREAEIKIEARADSLRIETDYPEYRRGEGRRWDRDDQPAAVEYRLTVPRSAVIEDFNLINGGLELENLSGPVKANSINGRVAARGLTGPVNLSVINGALEVGLDRLSEGQSVTLSSVNGQVTVTLPSDASAHLRASTVHGSIRNDFNLPVRVGEYVGRDLEGRLGAGSARVRLSNVNGQINLRRAADNRPPSPVTNLLSETRGRAFEGGDDNDAEEIVSGVRESVGEAMRGAREIEREASRAAREASREAARASREAAREAARATRELERGPSATARSDQQRQTARESNTLAVSGQPRVRLETFDGAINVRAWDKPEVSYTATKRAAGDREMQGIKVLAHGGGTGEVVIRTEFDKAFAREHVERAGRTVVFSSNASVELDVYVPRNSTLFVSSGDGRVRVEGVSGEIELRTGDGPVEVSDSRGRLRAVTGDGPVRVTNFEGDAEARTGDGRITLDGRFNSLSARTGDGTISLTIPEDLGVNIETNARHVTSDGMAVEEAAGDGRLRRWRVGGGGNTLRLHTTDGQVVIRRR